jgi:hypothetical protein
MRWQREFAHYGNSKCNRLSAYALGKWQDSESCLDRRFELITTVTRVIRILVVAVFFVSVVDFSLDNARFDLVVMTAAIAIFLSGGLRSP